MSGISSNDGDVVDALSQAFLDLKESFDSGVSAQTAITTSRTLEVVNHLRKYPIVSRVRQDGQRDFLTCITYKVHEIYIQKLKPAEMDAADRDECFPGTRLDVIDHISNWVMDPNPDSNILWLYGLAGSGKSTISTTLYNFFWQLRRLGAFLFFDKEWSDPKILIKTLAFQLAEFDGRIYAAIANAIKQSPKFLKSNFSLQFEKYLVKPLASEGLNDLHQGGPIVIIIDALDQCGNAQSRAALLDVFERQLPKLPACYRFIFTSRLEPDIHDFLMRPLHVLQMQLDITSESTASDILSYLRHQMGKVRNEKRHTYLPEDWPGEHRLRSLAQRAAGLFVWASIATNFIRFSYNPDKRLDILLGQAREAEDSLNELYKTTLDSAGDWDEPDFRLEFCEVVGIIIVARIPLSCEVMDQLRGPDVTPPSLNMVNNLGSVLTRPPHPIRTLHSSFDDFLLNMDRCGDKKWHIDMTTHNFQLAQNSLACLTRFFATPIQFKLSTTFDTMNKLIPAHVSYASMFWTDHVCAVDSVDCYDALVITSDEFLRHHFLHWLEALSILGKSREATRMMGNLQKWIVSSLLS